MGPSRRLLIGGVVLLAATGGFAAGRGLLRSNRRVTQPIAFNHRKHVESLDCETCHEYYGRAYHSGLPKLDACLMCHGDPQTDLAEEQKVRDLAAAGGQDVFRKLFRLPDNVFYSHRRHVVVAGLSCETCHGAIAQTEVPPEAPLVRITMDFCVDCHERSAVSTACTRCHR